MQINSCFQLTHFIKYTYNHTHNQYTQIHTYTNLQTHKITDIKTYTHIKTRRHKYTLIKRQTHTHKHTLIHTLTQHKEKATCTHANTNYKDTYAKLIKMFDITMEATYKLFLSVNRFIQSHTNTYTKIHTYTNIHKYID